MPPSASTSTIPGLSGNTYGPSFASSLGGLRPSWTAIHDKSLFSFTYDGSGSRSSTGDQRAALPPTSGLRGNMSGSAAVIALSNGKRMSVLSNVCSLI